MSGDRIALHHGTSAENAALLLERGFDPGEWRCGPNGGRRGLLCLTDEPENARWYADRFRDGAVLTLLVRREDLMVDPDDGVWDTVGEELASALPACLATRAPVGPEHISVHAPAPDEGARPW